MLKGKVYLSRSAAGNGAQLNTIREMLKADPNITLVEYTGIRYTVAEDNKLLACDWVIVFPPKPEADISKDLVAVGKGQFTQVETFLKKHTANAVKVVTQVANDFFNYRDLYEVSDDDDHGDWKDNYGDLEMVSQEYETYNRKHTPTFACPFDSAIPTDTLLLLLSK